MGNKNIKEIVYSINIEDIQEVANQVLERDLTRKELGVVKKAVGDNIDWFQAIELSINEHIKVNE